MYDPHRDKIAALEAKASKVSRRRHKKDARKRLIGSAIGAIGGGLIARKSKRVISALGSRRVAAGTGAFLGAGAGSYVTDKLLPKTKKTRTEKKYDKKINKIYSQYDDSGDWVGSKRWSKYK